MARKLIEAAIEASPNKELHLQPSQVAFIVEEVSPDQLVEACHALGDALETVSTSGLPFIHELLREATAAVELSKSAEESARKAAAERKAAEAKAAAEKAAKLSRWEPEELSMLAKAVRKFPSGSQNRWGIIANYVNTQLKLKVEKTKEECLKKYMAVQSNLVGKGESADGAAGAGAAGGSSPKASNGSGGGPASAAAESKSSTGGGASAGQQKDASASDEEWSQVQQQALEAALKNHPAASFADQKERWKAIAQAVPGKNKKQCVERFKSLRAALRSKK